MAAKRIVYSQLTLAISLMGMQIKDFVPILVSCSVLQSASIMCGDRASIRGR